MKAKNPVSPLKGQKKRGEGCFVPKNQKMRHGTTGKRQDRNAF